MSVGAGDSPARFEDFFSSGPGTVLKGAPSAMPPNSYTNSGSSRADLFVPHRIPQLPHALHANLTHLPRRQRPHSLRRSRRNKIARTTHHLLRNITNHYTQRKNKIPRVPLLPQRAIHARLHPTPGPRIKPIHHHRAHRTERIAALGPRPLPVFFLQIARRYIVQAAIPQNITPHILIDRRLVACLADHYAQFAFIIHTLA